MKFVSSIFILVLACVTSLVMGQDVAIVVILNTGGQPVDDGICSPGDNASMQAALNSAVGAANKLKLSRNLRTSRQLADPSWCAAACAGYPKGGCRIAYPQCKTTRMLLLESTNDSGSSPVEDVLVDDSGRKDEEVNAALLKKCSKVEGYVEKAIKNELESGGLTSTCYDLFSKTTVLKCIVVPPS